jgi:glycosyltransferase involved in cell wall biosynthesis
MRIAYLTDQRFYNFRDAWYTFGAFPLHEFQTLFPFIDEWVIYGRLNELKGEPIGLKKINMPSGAVVQFQGVYNVEAGLKGYCRNIIKYLRGAYRAMDEAEIIWLKLPFVVSLAYICFHKRRNKVVISQMIGDPVQGTLGRHAIIRVISYIYAALVRHIIRRCDLPVFVSQYLANKYGRNINSYVIANESRINSQLIIREDQGLFRPVNSVPRILYIGRLSPEKGLLNLFYALKLLRSRILFKALIIGDGLMNKQLKDLATKIGLEDTIHFTGAVPWGDELFSIMRQCDVLVLPSQTEGFGLVIIEAMSQGVPVVATKVGGIPEIVMDRVSGLLVSPNSPKELSNALFDAIFDQELRKRLIINGIKVASKNTFIEQTGKIAKLVEKLLIDKKMLRRIQF